MRSLRDLCAVGTRTDTLAAAVMASIAALAATSFGIPAAPAVPATATATAIPAPPTTTTGPATRPEAATRSAGVKSFVGVITADRVYVRPGPGTEFYQLAQLGKNDTVQVVDTRGSWYQIVPPANLYCLIGQDFVEPAADGKTGTVKKDYVNVRAGSVVQTNRADAILAVARKGTAITILGATDIAGTKFYKIAPLDKTYVYVSSQYVRVAPGGTIPHVDAVPPRDNYVEISPPSTSTAPATQPVDNTRVVVVAPVPVKTFAPGAFEKFDELNQKTVAELRKPVLEQDAGSMLESWKTFLLTDNLPPSIKQAAEARVAAAERILGLQKTAKENRSDPAFDQARKDLQEQSEAALKAVEAAQNTGPYSAEGILRSSTVVVGRYALVNPITQRVVAYIDPSSEMDLSKLLDSYIGVRGAFSPAKDGEIRVIKVRNATMLPSPKITTGGK